MSEHIEWDVTFDGTPEGIHEWLCVATFSIAGTKDGWDVSNHQLPTFVLPRNTGNSARANAQHIIGGLWNRHGGKDDGEITVHMVMSPRLPVDPEIAEHERVMANAPAGPMRDHVATGGPEAVTNLRDFFAPIED
jgi:hypothetical protein